MRNFKTLLLAVLFLGGISMVQAQSKVAHVDTQEIVKTYPAYLSAAAEAEKAGETAAKSTATKSRAQYDDMVKAFETKAQQYAKEGNTQTQAVNEARQKELEQMKQAIYQEEQRIQQNIQQSVQEAQIAKIAPVQKKIKDAINAVAKTLGYDYILEKGTLIVANGKDITADVKKQLGY
ncbi:OmpH family outer membrane protein [Winogradskyella litorisediminis]|uniref:OmpH family outer membrane protein n=1 Tax=Winogradskyella litorisediminis TaxID=1156618 RepID=A0ABW3N5R8_9FLAO